MTTLIVYATNHGCALKCVDRLASRLGGRVMSVDLKKNEDPDPGNYDAVIVGGSIHAGHIQKKIGRYLKWRGATLKTKTLGLFICCMEEGEKAEQQFKDAFPADFIAHATATGLFGGEFDFAKMNFLEKAMIKKASGVTQSVSKIREDVIDAFAAKISPYTEGGDGL
jgi:menaquinone-dependent protoporphyrinogen oxidase